MPIVTTLSSGAQLFNVPRVTKAMIETVATDSILGRATAATGNVEVLTALPFAYTGDVTRSADSNATTIATNAVTNAKSAQMAANTMKGNNTASTANAADLTVAQANVLLGTSGLDIQLGRSNYIC